MKIATWNLLIFNKRQNECIDFLRSLDTDFLCLQEVRVETIGYLQKIFPAVQFCFAQKMAGIDVFSVIAGKATPVRSETIRMDVRNTFLSKITLSDYRHCEYVYNDYHIGDQDLRLYNLHLPYGISASERCRLLQNILNMLGNGANIICGDLNSFGHFPWNLILGPLNASPFKDYITSEMVRIKDLARKEGLKLSCPDGAITYPLCRTEIDHIIIPQKWSEFDCRLYTERHGSDHNMLLLEESELDSSMMR